MSIHVPHIPAKPAQVADVCLRELVDALDAAAAELNAAASHGTSRNVLLSRRQAGSIADVVDQTADFLHRLREGRVLTRVRSSIEGGRS